MRLQEMSKPNYPVVKTGPFGSSMKTEHFRSHGIPVLTIQSLGEGEIQTDGLFFVNDAKAEELSTYKVHDKDLVFSRVADIGRSVVITEKENDWLISPNLMRISVDQKRFDSWFLMYSIVGGGLVTEQIQQIAGTTGRPVVSSAMLRNITFAIPPLEEQKVIAEQILQAETVMRHGLTEISQLNIIRQGLMQDLLTGRVRVVA
jgi:type I restriction enzyme, S subunit